VVYIPAFADLFGLKPVTWQNWLIMALVAPALILVMKFAFPRIKTDSNIEID